MNVQFKTVNVAASDGSTLVPPGFTMGCKAVSAREIVELHFLSNEFASLDLPRKYGMERLTVPKLPNETSRPGPQKTMIFYFMAPCQNVISQVTNPCC